MSIWGCSTENWFPSNPNRPSATITGTPAGFKDFEDYFNPRIVSSLPLYATSPSFATAVNLCSCPPHQQGGARGCPRPWDNRPYGRKTRSQEALRVRAERKVQRHFRTIKTRNNPRSVYVHDFQRLSQSHNINVHHDVYQTLDLAMAFKGITVVMLSDPPQETQISNQKSERPFGYNSLSPSPTSTKKSGLWKL